MYRTITYDNGLRLITSAMPHTMSVSINIFVGTGSRYETDREAGASHFIEHVCFRGTEKRRTAAEICSAIESTGGMLNAGTDKELTTFYCKVAEPHFAGSMDVMADIVTGATFQPREIEKERQVIIEEINMSLDTPPSRAAMLLDEILWPDHPLGRDIAGTRESVNGISRDMLLEYLHREYQPANTVVAIAGNIDDDAAAGMVGELLGSWKSGPARPGYRPFEPVNGRKTRVHPLRTEQAQLCIGMPGPSVIDPERFKFGVLNVILGDGMSSRLFTVIRDELGLAYSIHSYPEYFLDTGSLTISAGVDDAQLKTAVKAILEELGRLKQGIPEDEVTRARELFKGRTMLRMEDSQAVAGWLGAQCILHQNVYTVEEVLAMVDETTPDDLVALAQRYLVGDKLRMSVVGPIDPDESLDDLLVL